MVADVNIAVWSGPVTLKCPVTLNEVPLMMRNKYVILKKQKLYK